MYIGARLAIFIPEDYAKLALGILILSIAAIQFFCETRPLKEQTDDLPVQKHVFGGLGFFVIAMLNGSLTSGTGLLFTMWLVYWYRQPFVLSLSYTMIVCSLFYNATGAVVLSSDVSISLPFVTSLVLGAIIGGFCGASFSLKKGELFIKKIFVASCTLLGAVLVCQSLHGLF